jgi:hypothetical protein
MVFFLVMGEKRVGLRDEPDYGIDYLIMIRRNGKILRRLGGALL